MTFSRHSLRALSLVIVSALATAVGGCWVEPDQPIQPRTIEPGYVPVDPVAPVVPAKVDIATHETLLADGGKGIGVYVEYLGEGQWHLWTTCDSLFSRTPCRFSLTGTPETGAQLSGLQRSDGSDLTDSLGTLSRDSFDLGFNTTTERDGVTFRIETPGSGLTLVASLDGVADKNMIFWVGPDGLHDRGAPTNPVTFIPTEP